jgi:hypothetical protein
MGHDRDRGRNGITVAVGQPLIGILVDEGGRRLVRYFTEGGPNAEVSGTDETLAAALAVIGAWSDLDWEEFASDLDRIRHESRPTPPIDV